MSDPLLSAHDIAVTLGNREVLCDVSLDVLAGEIVSIMGPSGSGKSTLLHVLAGILRPDAGHVDFAGARLDSRSETARSRTRLESMGFVFQFGDLIPELTMLENVCLPLRLLGVGARAADQRARVAMRDLGIEGIADHTLASVSGGQAQRTAVARAIVHRPKIVFADEPTGALDTIAGENVMEALTGLAEQNGTTVVLVTHDVRVAAYADRNITLRDGRIAGAALMSA